MDDTAPPNKDNWKMMKNYKAAVAVGAFSVGGLFIARMLRGSTMPIEMNQILMAAGTSTAAAWAAPYVSNMIICENSDSAPYVETAVSTGLTWPVMYALTRDMATANMYLPVQLGATLAGNAAVAKWKKMKAVEPENLPGLVGSCGE